VWSERIRDELIRDLMAQLELTRKPVAVRYAPEAGPSAETTTDGTLPACEAVRLASEGSVLRLGTDSSACALGPHFLRIGRPSAEDAGKAFEELLFSGDKASCFLEEVPGAQPVGVQTRGPLGNSLILSPLEAAQARPDVVLFVCNFEQACRLIALDSQDGQPGTVELRGAACYRAMTYPMVSGNLNVTLMNNAGRLRHGYRADDLLVSIPIARFERMLAGAARAGDPGGADIPDSLRALLRERCSGADN
jgi:uncharacterized protein (DUF169 family)